MTSAAVPSASREPPREGKRGARRARGCVLALAAVLGGLLQAAPPALATVTVHHHPKDAPSARAKHAHEAAAAGAAARRRAEAKHARVAEHHEGRHDRPRPHRHVPGHAPSHAVTAAAAGAAAGAAAAAVPPAPPAAPAAPPEATDKGTNTGLPLPRFAALRADRVYLRRGPGDRYPIDWVYHRRGLPVQIEREFDVWRLVSDSDGQKGWVHQATLYGSRTFVIPGDPSAPPASTDSPPPAASPGPAAPASAAPAATAASGTSASGTATSGTAPAPAAGSGGKGAEGERAPRSDPRILRYVQTQEEARAEKNAVLLMSHPEDDSAVVAVLLAGTVGNIKTCPQSSQWCRVAVKGYEGWLPRRLFWGVFPGEAIQSN